MKRVIGVIILILLFVPNGVNAHTGLQTAIPVSGETVDQEITEIRLEFNTNIESLSTLAIKDSSGRKADVKGIETKGGLLTATLSSPLPTEAYTVDWKIVGKDGHVIEGDYAFTVNIPESVNRVVEEQPVNTSDSKQTIEEPKTNIGDNQSELQIEQTNSVKDNLSWLLIIIGCVVLLLVVLISYVYFRTKRKE